MQHHDVCHEAIVVADTLLYLAQGDAHICECAPQVFEDHEILDENHLQEERILCKQLVAQALDPGNKSKHGKGKNKDDSQGKSMRRHSAGGKFFQLCMFYEMILRASSSHLAFS